MGQGRRDCLDDATDAVVKTRHLLSLLPQRIGGAPHPHLVVGPDGEDPGAVVPTEQRKVYDVRDVANAVVVQPEAGHYPWIDDPAAFSAALAGFLG